MRICPSLNKSRELALRTKRERIFIKLGDSNLFYHPSSFLSKYLGRFWVQKSVADNVHKELPGHVPRMFVSTTKVLWWISMVILPAPQLGLEDRGSWTTDYASVHESRECLHRTYRWQLLACIIDSCVSFSKYVRMNVCLHACQTSCLLDNTASLCIIDAVTHAVRTKTYMSSITLHW